MARPSAPRPGGPPDAAATKGARPNARVLALVAGGVVLATVAAVVFFMLGSSPGGPTPAVTATGQSADSSGQDALGPGATAPGDPVVTAQRAGATQARFTWTYVNQAVGDSFRWQRKTPSSGAAGGVTTKPELVISVPQGRSVCIVVQVRRADGQASNESQPACWSN
jgi:hypothetical protein